MDYSFTTLSSEKTAVTVTLPFVGSVMSAEAVGASGASLSMFETSKVVMSERLPAASVPRKLTVPLSLRTMPSV